VPTAEKGPAINRIASDLGTSVAHAAGGSGGGAAGGVEVSEAMADLFLALDGEVDQFRDQAIPPPKRGPGRPKGSPNRSTKQMAQFLAARGYRDPLEFLAAVWSADTRELAASLLGKAPKDVTADQVLDVLRQQLRAAESALPYLHQKTPTQVEMQVAEARPLIIIHEGNQSLRDVSQNRSHGDGSHDNNQVIDIE
jgi:hypothetical protein